jgi:DNA-binding GntR family transcriptional regulator
MADPPDGTTTRRHPATLPPVAKQATPYERLKRSIVSGEFPAGAPLTETALAEWYQVSRTPIREALTRLEQDGLVKRVDRGLIVREDTLEETLDLYETRIVLECMAASVAAERRTSFDLIAMRRAADRHSRAQISDIVETVETNRDFHRSVWRASHNESLIDLLERLNLHLMKYSATTLVQPGRHDEAIAEHAQLIECVDPRDADAASALAKKHFTTARELRIRQYEAGTDFDGR